MGTGHGALDSGLRIIYTPVPAELTLPLAARVACSGVIKHTPEYRSDPQVP